MEKFGILVLALTVAAAIAGGYALLRGEWDQASAFFLAAILGAQV